jgi:hypothetical protein
MTDWHDLAKKFLSSLYEDTPNTRWDIGKPASADQITDFENKVGYILPTEFHSFYQSMNGCGVWMGERCYRGIEKLEEIDDSFESVEIWLEDYPIDDRRFIPFINHATGDYSGYLFSTTGRLYDGLFYFSHEEIDEDPDDDSPLDSWEKLFIDQMDGAAWHKSISDFLLEEWKENQ